MDTDLGKRNKMKRRGKRIRPRYALILLNLAIIISSFLIYYALGSYAHISPLYDNGNWISTKLTLDKGVVGAVSFMVTKYPLRMNKLDLSSWNGFQEITYKDEIALSMTDFDFMLDDRAYLIFIFNKDATGFSGIRISNNERYSSMYFNADAEGKFESKTNLNVKIRKDKINHMRVLFSDDGLTLYINDALSGKINIRVLEKQKVGFRGSMNPAYIDNIAFYNKDKEIVFKEKFSGIKPLLPALLVFLIQLLINLLFFIFSENNKNLFFKLILLNFIIICLISFFYLSYIMIILDKYPTNPDKIDWRGLKTAIEDESSVMDRIKDDYGSGESSKHRIMFIGTSQTWGAGASVEDKTFVSRIELLLNNNTKDQSYNCINGGISGLNSSKLYLIYHDALRQINPDTLVIDLSNNDYDKTELKKNLNKFVLFDKEHEIKTIFVLEPNIIDSPEEERLLRNHDMMRQLAVENNVTVVDMHTYLLEHYDDGFIWWDSVHLTDFGQKIFAEQFYNQTKDILRFDAE